MTKARDLANAGTALSAVSATELGYLDGVTSAVQTQINSKQAVVSGVNDTEIGYLDGVTSAIQTQLDAKIPKTLTTTTGDIIYASGANTPARLGIGSTDQVLTVSGGVPTWATAAGGAKNYSLINSGGTALTGSATITVSGISGKNSLMILIVNGSSVNASTQMLVRFNSDTGSNYSTYGFQTYGRATYSKDQWSMNSGTGTSFGLAVTGNSSSSALSGYIFVDGANSTSTKVIQTVSSGDQGGSSAENYAMMLGGLYTGTSTISSVSIISSSGNWDAGTVYVYGA